MEAVISLGGPMNVYEEEKFPFLREEDIFIKHILKKKIPFLGICLGAQLLAKACGAKVKKARKSEIGWYKVLLTRDGLEDPLFLGVDNTIDVFEWHEDTFELPQGGKLLATSKDCINQAFRYGDNAYGLQFHIEVNDEMIKEWQDEYYKKEDLQSQKRGIEMQADYYGKRNRFNEIAAKIYLNFSRIISNRQK